MNPAGAGCSHWAGPMVEPREYCRTCDRVTPSRILRMATETREECAICGTCLGIEATDEPEDTNPLTGG